MTEREDIIEQIDLLRRTKEHCAHMAMLVQHTDPARADRYDQAWNAASALAARLKSQLTPAANAPQTEPPPTEKESGDR
jgi:hypothetical protein